MLVSHPYSHFFPHTVLQEFVKDFQPRGFPIYDVIHEEDAVFLEFALAGYSAEQLRVEIEGSILKVSANKSEDESKQGRRIASRAFSVPFKAEGYVLEESVVSFVDGMLRIEVPRKQPVTPEVKQLEIVTDVKALPSG